MHGNLEPDEDVLDWDIEDMKKSYREAVSYTHLTLPTIYSV